MEILELKPNWHVTYGQIVTLGMMPVPMEIKEAGAKYMKLLLENMLDNASDVPLRVSLATISRLRTYRSIVNEMVNSSEKVQKICQIAEIAWCQN